MNETTAQIIVAIITVFGAIITKVISGLAKKGVNYLDNKTSILDKASQLHEKEVLKNRMIGIVDLVVRSTMQTYVKKIKAASTDGKLTKKEAKEAYAKTWNTATAHLENEGIKFAHGFLKTTIEATVNRVKPIKNFSGGPVKSAISPIESPERSD